ncbi:queuosine salvage family protein [Patescibacteria group bacterium]|nr:queuosine salvage family protein [Patescibacteria group bacterium]
MNNQTIVNEKQCRLIAEKLMPLELRQNHFQRLFLNFPADTETKLRAWLFATAICHQTHILINKKKNLVGWDFLEYVYSDLGKENSPLLDPHYLARLTAPELAEKLKPLFADDGNHENCTLDRLEERARFIIEISKQLNEKYEGKVENILQKSNGFLFNNGNGLYELLEQLPPFADPLRKKSTIFIKWIVDGKLMQIKDPQNFVPIMDYHMQRVLLRTGCVEVLDAELRESLRKKKPLASDEPIRNAAVEAIRKISQFSNKDISEIHDFFYPLGRSCCKEKTLCIDKTCDKNPCTFFLFVNIPEHEKCIFEGVCKGNADETYRNFWQPIVGTHYY